MSKYEIFVECDKGKETDAILGAKVIVFSHANPNYITIRPHKYIEFTLKTSKVNNVHIKAHNKLINIINYLNSTMNRQLDKVFDPMWYHNKSEAFI